MNASTEESQGCTGNGLQLNGPETLSGIGGIVSPRSTGLATAAGGHRYQDRYAAAILAGVIALIAISGCRTNNVCDERSTRSGLGCANCEDIPRGAIPQPLGSYVCAWQRSHAQEADRDDYVLYSYQFGCGGDRLTPDGERHVRKLMSDPNAVIRPLIVETVDDAELAARRRSSVISYLAHLGVVGPEELVRIGESRAEGLLGQEAQGISRRITSQSSSASGRGGQQSSFGGGGIL